MRFHMTHVTLEFYRVCPKRLPSICYIRRKPCAYLASGLALSPTGPMITNNQAEYEAILKGLQLLHEVKAEAIKVFGDS